ncbi:hypothetical protein GGD68_004628 [Paraburkholderia fungorum]|uniref:Transposase n=1 Tax=Paraburkholderia fungorum TaxID=134537 RepID=A0AAW3V008_9BURK|nr:hypothetical protein [Paraburkholderia fungorum]MBB6203748.1 hypothetical protein [Paraburkholderia fungorum]
MIFDRGTQFEAHPALLRRSELRRISAARIQGLSQDFYSLHTQAAKA